MNYIFKKLLFRKRLPFKRRVKNIIFYLSRTFGAKRYEKSRYKKVHERNSEYAEPLEEHIEQQHIDMWSIFREKVNPDTLRICSHISGKSDPRIVPENIFKSDIELSFKTDPSIKFFSNKSFYNRWFPKGIFPADKLHNVDGQYLDADLSEIDFDTFTKKCRKIRYPVVFKPNSESSGGKGIHFVENSEQLIQHAKDNRNFVVQEQIKQHEFYNRYNSHGLNTFRVYLYRSVKDNTLHVLNIAFRMGQGGSLDNITAGGIYTVINDIGRMNGFAVDLYGRKYTKHPDTGLSFDKEIPDFEDLKKLCLEVGSQIFLARLIGLDASYDEDRKWRIVEINLNSTSIGFSQFGGGEPFFGKFTEEVIEYCKANHWVFQQ